MLPRRITRNLAALAMATCCLDTATATCIGAEDTAVPVSTPTSAFQVLADGTVADPRTHLMWTRCLVGQSLVGNACQGTATLLHWSEALNAARSATFAGHADWRLPNPKEVLSIMEDRCAAPSLNADLFPVTDFETWTTTPSNTLLNGTYEDVLVVGADGAIVPLDKLQVMTFVLVRNLP